MIKEINKKIDSFFVDFCDIATPELMSIQTKYTTSITDDLSKGHITSNVCMIAAGILKKNPVMLSKELASNLSQSSFVESAESAGPGFVNIKLTRQAFISSINVANSKLKDYGNNSFDAKKKIQIEFVSANPTGPLHLGHTRWAAVGDAIARVLEAEGAESAREFYINDLGVQMDKFGNSVKAAALGEAIPEDGYHGAYIPELAKQVVSQNPGITELPEPQRSEAFRDAAYALQLADQKRVLDNFNTHFDVWTSEKSLHTSGAVNRGFEKLKSQGHMFVEEGATWLRTSDFDDDKDRVLIKADGALTYFASDTAYYVDKRNRGYDLCIYLLGADHHGYVNRLRAVAACAGDNPDENIQLLIGQMVKMLKNGEEVRLSKRAGNIITLEDLVDEVGVDAARYSLIRYPVESPLVLDLDLLVSSTNDNPVYYVQYAHARIASVVRNAAELGLIPANTSDWDPATFDPSQLTDDREGALLGLLADYPRVVASAAELREPHRIARYIEEVATSYHSFYAACRVLPQGDEPVTELNIARLWLCAATRQVIFNGLELLGVSAPDRM